MALEIERRFLIDQAKFPLTENNAVAAITQGYLNNPSAKYVTRIRLVNVPGASRGYLTLKCKLSSGIAREYEYPIPSADAASMLLDCEASLIRKNRHLIGPWEVDFFKGVHEGIVIAEIELEGINQEFERPDWLGREITDVKALSNFQMSQDPGLAKAVFDELVVTHNM